MNSIFSFIWISAEENFNRNFKFIDFPLKKFYFQVETLSSFWFIIDIWFFWPDWGFEALSEEFLFFSRICDTGSKKTSLFCTQSIKSNPMSDMNQKENKFVCKYFFSYTYFIVSLYWLVVIFLIFDPTDCPRSEKLLTAKFSDVLSLVPIASNRFPKADCWNFSYNK